MKRYPRIVSKISSKYRQILVAVFCFIMLFAMSFYTLDPDFGWHLSSGQYMLKNGIPKTDIFTYTAHNFPWINHEWLHDVLIALMYGFGGYFLLAFLFAAIWLCSLYLAGRKYNLFILMLAMFSLISYAGIRPLLWTVLCVAVLERVLESNQKKIKFIIPVIFLIWANLHGGFVFGLLIISLYQIFYVKKLPWQIFILSFLVTLLNPYGLKIFAEIFMTLSDSQLKYSVAEWGSLFFPLKSMICLVLFMGLIFVAVKKPWRQLYSLPGLTLCMAFMSIRHFPLLTTVSLRYLERYADELKPFWRKHGSSKAMISIASVLFVFFTFHTIKEIIYRQTTYPLSAIHEIKQLGCAGNIFNSYNFGGFLIWQLPQYKVYIDGRMPSWKLGKINYFSNYMRFLHDDDYRRQQIEALNIHCILLTSNDANNTLHRKNSLLEQLQTEDWIYVKNTSSEKYILLRKKGIKNHFQPAYDLA